MSGDCSGLLLRAVRARMVADAGITAEVGTRVYETVPENATFPVIGLHDQSFEAWDTDTSSGASHEIVFACFTRGEDARVVARRINAAITACLDRCAASLTVTGHKVVSFAFVRSLVFRTEDADKGSAMGVVYFNVTTEQLAAASGY